MSILSDNKVAPDDSIKRIDTCHYISTEVDTILKEDRLRPFLNVQNKFFPIAYHIKKMFKL